MTRTRSRAVCGAALTALALALGACGGDDEEQPAAASDTATATVSVDEVDGVGTVLVDQSGAALYTSEQEADGKVRCTGGCLEFWIPVAASGEPTATDDVTGELGTVERPDGSTQVTHDGAPLYRFSEDKGPGQVTGDGLSDEFDGETFTWHVVTTDGSSSEGTDTGPSYGY